MRDDFKKSPNPEAGQPGFLVSKLWLDNYKTYIHYDGLRRSMPITQSFTHCKDYCPKEITNTDFLETADDFLCGTGTAKGFEASVFDRYI